MASPTATVTHDETTYTATVSGDRVSIDAGGHWACDGDWGGISIDNAPAPLPAEVFALLEDALYVAGVVAHMARYADEVPA